MSTLLGSVGKPLGSKGFGKAAFLLEFLQLIFHLLAKHHYQTVAQHKKAIGFSYGVFSTKPLVKFVLLG